MKIYDFSEIDKGMEMSPSTAKFIQEGMLDRFESLMNALTGSSLEIIVLHGCEWTQAGSDYTMTEGVVYYNGKIKFVPVFTGKSVSGSVPVWNANVVLSDPKARFADSTFKYVFSSDEMKLEMGVAGTGISDWDETLPFVTALAIALGFGSGEWVPVTSYGTGVTGNVCYRIIANQLCFKGKIEIDIPTAGFTHFTLPVGFRPSIIIYTNGYVTCPVVQINSDDSVVAGNLFFNVSGGVQGYNNTASPASVTTISFDNAGFYLN